MDEENKKNNKEAAASSSSSDNGHMTATPHLTVGYGVRGFSNIDNLALVTVEGTGMIGVPGVCARIFTCMREGGMSVVLITQAGSEHSICFALPFHQGAAAVSLLRRELRDELESGDIQTVEASAETVACLAIVGDGMKLRCGIAARMFTALAKANIPIMAIAQGSSERNISAIVQQDVAQLGLKAMHKAFITEEESK